MTRRWAFPFALLFAAAFWLIYNRPNMPLPPIQATPTLYAGCRYVQGVYPDPLCTPGAIDPSVTQANIHTTICVAGYTETVRPPLSYTEPLKSKLVQRYAAPGDLRNYELDHFVPLELGGHPTDERNLWPEPGASPNPKDAVENKLHSLVCDGLMTLDEAQRRIVRDWRTAVP